ncbi:hypothetical protein [Microvirga sp. M2]|uniref:hypothetical protein n=1 Tax=Microvirga sp. M2 TaxID=3073270 RepID=UPI0039C466B5
MVKPGECLSLRNRRRWSRHWVAASSAAEVTVNGNTGLAHQNGAIHIPAGAMLRFANPGAIPLEVVEVQIVRAMGEDGTVSNADIGARVVGAR